ncbi:hypothetical protein GPJ56_002379 [Histomonas meleagridis]|uniref:uncharacterized protein n=1 Tax=Histomonas meleagridis TaxID=135588 RepID=UPI00355AB321|nr:hypothetical protein GPJ56_002379 [Histomonas meleagridis]KAH0801889.1 hypothetical protein GO595_005307 [Histomonas meleagridis]
MSMNISLNINVDANKLIDQVACATNRSSINDRYFDNDNGRFISCQSDGKLIAACFHKTKSHSATCEVHNNFTKNFGVPDHIVRSAKSSAPAGVWAVAYCDSGKLGGDKTFYNVD